MAAIRARFEKKKKTEQDETGATPCEAGVPVTNTDPGETASSSRQHQEKYDEWQKGRKEMLEETERRRKDWLKSTKAYTEKNAEVGARHKPWHCWTVVICYPYVVPLIGHE